NSILQFNFLDANGNNRWSNLIDENGAVTTQIFQNPQTSAAGTAPEDKTFLLVANVDPLDTVSSDISRIKIFRNGDALPETLDDIDWDVEATNGNTGAFLNTIQIIALGDIEIDEIRIRRDNGGTLDDVLLSTGNPNMVDTFDAMTGSLVGANGGTGWNSAWAASASLPELSVGAGSLDYPSFDLGGFQNETVLMLSRIQSRQSGASTGGYQVRIKFFQQGDIPPASERAIDWDYIADSNSSLFLRKLRIVGTSTGGTTTIDDVNVSTTYAGAIAGFCVVDLNVDGIADFFDLSVISNLANSNSAGADFNGDSSIDGADIDDFTAGLNAGCE
ncbi:MAG: hypothetical protein AAGB34_04020, partial [Planctomycetota bacterium]